MPCGLAHVPSGRDSRSEQGSGTPLGFLPSFRPPASAPPAGDSDSTTMPFVASGLNVTISPGEPPKSVSGPPMSVR